MMTNIILYTTADTTVIDYSIPDSLDWEHAPMMEISIDDFEDGRPYQQRHRSSLRMPASHRHQILMEEWEVSLSKIMKAAIEIWNVQEERTKTARSALRQQRSREALQSALRKVKKIFRWNNKSRPQQWKRRTHELLSADSLRKLKKCRSVIIEKEQDSAESSSPESSDEECLYSNESDEEMDYYF